MNIKSLLLISSSSLLLACGGGGGSDGGGSNGGGDTGGGSGLACSADSNEQNDTQASVAGVSIRATSYSQANQNHCDDGNDWATTQLNLGDKLTVSTSGLGDSANTVVEIYTAAGVKVASNDDCSDDVSNTNCPSSGNDLLASKVTYEASATGKYSILIKAKSNANIGDDTEYSFSRVMVANPATLRSDNYDEAAALITAWTSLSHDRLALDADLIGYANRWISAGSPDRFTDVPCNTSGSFRIDASDTNSDSQNDRYRIDFRNCVESSSLTLDGDIEYTNYQAITNGYQADVDPKFDFTVTFAGNAYNFRTGSYSLVRTNASGTVTHTITSGSFGVDVGDDIEIRYSSNVSLSLQYENDNSYTRNYSFDVSNTDVKNAEGIAATFSTESPLTGQYNQNNHLPSGGAVKLDDAGSNAVVKLTPTDSASSITVTYDKEGDNTVENTTNGKWTDY